jgi:hypothetical protein
MTATASTQDRLHTVRARLTNARKARTVARQAVDAARQFRDADAEAVAQQRLDDADHEAEAALCQMISDRLFRGMSAGQIDDAIGLERGTAAEMIAAYGVVRRPGMAKLAGVSTGI